MRKLIGFSVFLAAVGVVTAFILRAEVPAPAAHVGQTAPGFTLPGSDGKNHSLQDYSGKFVVLEWTNPGCPFVQKFYSSNTMQKLQKEYTAKGVSWIRINSGAPNHEGYQTPTEMASYEKENGLGSTVSLVDSMGTVGHEYGATNTPQMFVIDPKGTLIYAGGIDDHPSPYPDDIPNSKNYVEAALNEAMAGQPVTVSRARPYGCSIKY